MPSSKYTHLFFDLDNTIWDFNSNSFEALYETLNKLQLLGMIRSYEAFYKIYHEENERLWNLYRQGLMPKKKLSIERFETSFIKNGTPLKISGGIVNDLYLSEMVKQTKLIDGAIEVLEYLHCRYRIAIITNGFIEVQFDKISGSGLSKYFTKIFVSEEIGSPKPGRKIFEHAIKSMNAPKKSSLMIGDSWEADIIGAMNFGIDQIYFNPQMNNLPAGGVYFNANLNKDSNITINSPSDLTPESENFRKIKINTTLINHLEQLLIIL